MRPSASMTLGLGGRRRVGPSAGLALMAGMDHYWLPTASTFEDQIGSADGTVSGGAAFVAEGGTYSDKTATTRTAGRDVIFIPETGAGPRITMPAGALPALDTTDTLTLGVVKRSYNVVNGRRIIGMGSTPKGIQLSASSVGGFGAILADGTNTTTRYSSDATPGAVYEMVAVVVSAVSLDLWSSRNLGAFSTIAIADTARDGLGDCTPTVFHFGSQQPYASQGEVEIAAAFSTTDILTPSELADIWEALQ